MVTRGIPDDELRRRQGIPAEAAQRIGDSLRRQGAEHDGLGLWPRIAEAQVRFLKMLEDVTEEQAHHRTAEGEWMIAEVVYHALEGGRAVLQVVEALAAGTKPNAILSPDPAYMPTGRALRDLRRDYTLMCARFAALAPALTSATPRQPVHPHPFFGELSARGWFAFQRVHDMDHGGQIEKLREATRTIQG
jgi:hypothetical protein